jgi:hypothetical protein
MTEHYITAMVDTGSVVSIACRCGWLKLRSQADWVRVDWKEHLEQNR